MYRSYSFALLNNHKKSRRACIAFSPMRLLKIVNRHLPLPYPKRFQQQSCHCVFYNRGEQVKIANITVSRRLWLEFGLLTLLMLAMAVVGVNRLAQFNLQMNHVTHEKYPKTVIASDIVDDRSRTLPASLITAQTNYVEKHDEVRKLVADGTRTGAIDRLISEVRPVQSAFMAAVDKSRR